MNRVLAIFCTGVSLIIGGWVAEGLRMEAESSLGGVPTAPVAVKSALPRTTEVVSGVRVVGDPEEQGSDVFGYAGLWYAYRAGAWYRSRTYEGPYEAVVPNQVPANVRSLPSRVIWRVARF